MLSLGGVEALTRARGLIESSAKRIASGSLQPENGVDLLRGREQFEAGLKLVKTEDTLNRHLLDLLG